MACGILPCKSHSQAFYVLISPFQEAPHLSFLGPDCVYMIETQGTTPGRSKGSWLCSPRQ